MGVARGVGLGGVGLGGVWLGLGLATRLEGVIAAAVARTAGPAAAVATEEAEGPGEAEEPPEPVQISGDKDGCGDHGDADGDE